MTCGSRGYTVKFDNHEKMDCFSDDMGSADMENLKGLSLRDQRLRIEQLEKLNQSEYNAARDILENEQKPPCAAKILANYLPNTRPGLQNIVEKQQRQLCTLIEQHNGLQYTLRLRKSQLLQMEQTMDSLELDNNPDGDERHYDQHVRQLENCLEKMSIKITEAANIHNTYLQVQEHLHREVREMPHVLEKLQSTVICGQTELSKVAQMSQAAVAAVESTKGMLVQLERQLMMEHWEIEKQLNNKLLEKEREVEARMDREKDTDRRISRGPQKLKEQRKSVIPKDGLTDITEPTVVRVAHQSATQPNAQQSTVKIVKDMDDLKEALSCTELQELEGRLVSQRATRQQLHTQMTQCEELLAQQQEALVALELQYAQSKFNPGPSSERFEQMQTELCAELEWETQRCQEWEVLLAKARAVMQGVEQGVNNLFYRITCLPATKDVAATEAGLDAVEKLQEIDSRLTSLPDVELEKSEEGGASDKLWTFLVQSTMMEPRNCKQASCPTYNSNSEDTFQFRSQEDDYSLSRDEIKRCNKQLIEAHQPNKKANKGPKKS
ncbi:coiled-coil domain-containing protein 183-like [Alosa sapidissima]|uniref:coiled-coil domain-containing protein 183-like n=1 Tax=Alosa sapidissima TaxID=34773 RepID=UPI001C09C4C1|nr:coiled-coil domain-containing protein 183-like [Alosa sapidissima]